ncbi:MAG: hypothetical protein NC212_09745 [Staphylococcus sp.]|nr:hypothetical protein [Staphylococcus sp.]
MALLSSCEGRTGYLDNDQENTIDKLTDVEWILVYADYGLGNEYVYEDKTSIYRFDRTGKGWFGLGSVTDPTFKENIRYFQWTFTTSNFTVIQTAGNASDGFWLIKKLTSEELWVQWTTHDPVYYPNQTGTFMKYKARHSD